MNKYFVVIVFLLTTTLVFWACQNRNELKEFEVYYPNGKLKQRFFKRGDLIDSAVTEYFESGAIKSLVEFDRGQQSGSSRFYYETGELRKQSTFVNGVEEDSMKFFYKNGKLEEVSIMIHGKKEGMARGFFQDGVKRFKGEMKNDLKVGKWIFYDSSGSVDRAIYYSNDTVYSVLTATLFKDFLYGYEMEIPSNATGKDFLKDSLGCVGLFFSANVKNLGATFLSGVKLNSKGNFEDEIEKDLAKAKKMVPDLTIQKNDRLSENQVLVKANGSFKGQKMYVMTLYVKHRNDLLVFAANIPDKNVKEFKGVEDYFDGYLKEIRLLDPKIIIELVRNFVNKPAPTFHPYNLHTTYLPPAYHPVWGNCL